VLKALLNSPYYRTAARYLVLKTVVLGLAGLVAQSLMAHTLEKTDFGTVVWAWTMISILAPFGLPGISVSITGAAAQGLDRNFVRGSLLELKGSLGAGLVLLLMAVAYWCRQQPTLFWVFLVAAVSIPGVLLDTPLALWNGRENFRAMFRFSAGLRLVQLGALIAVLRLLPHPALIVASQATVAAAGNLGAFFYLLRTGGLNQGYSRKFESYGWRYTWLNIAGTLSAYLDKIIVGGFFGFKNLALFALGELIYTYVFKVPSNLAAQIFIPRLARMELAEAVGWVRRHHRYLAGAFILAAAGTAVLLPVVYPLLFTQRYAGSIYYGWVFLAAVAASSPTVLLGALLKSQALKRESTILTGCIVTVPLLTVSVGAYWGGVPGVAWGKVAGYAVISCAYVAMLMFLDMRTAKIKHHPDPASGPETREVSHGIP
jgi:O-antigen/teichoic acid export membrane protein